MPKLFPAVLVSAALAASSLALAQTTPPQPGQPDKTPPPSSTPPEKITPPAATPPAAKPAPGTAATEPQWHTPRAGELRASKLIGTPVRNTGGETVGDINDVVIGTDGKVAAVVVGVGGFLGIGERQVAVRFDSMQIGRGSDQRTTATVKATKESLKKAPEWSWSAEDNSGTKGTGSKPTR